MSRQDSTQGLNPSTSHHNPSPADHCLQTNVEDQSLPLVLYEPHANIQFLLRCQSSQWGGIAQSPGNHPDDLGELLESILGYELGSETRQKKYAPNGGAGHTEEKVSEEKGKRIQAVQSELFTSLVKPNAMID
ncbi:hypothetical protein PSTG_09749 [Puccinia striiformis f. sp. tritici PST-78]|uniref:Uncharacterized protein n=1 Tax=Puccinia striiformis f. sp. tritici PST-78 TaxID=1165861 RepID=A0A0L0VCK9_9BASI|nr:hypothetical protein PSTG_09749 [Puccinia striiformis f. sp. tritici PST-78]